MRRPRSRHGITASGAWWGIDVTLWLRHAAVEGWQVRRILLVRKRHLPLILCTWVGSRPVTHAIADVTALRAPGGVLLTIIMRTLRSSGRGHAVRRVVVVWWKFRHHMRLFRFVIEAGSRAESPWSWRHIEWWQMRTHLSSGVMV